ncbi:hypothetical protein EB796_000510 [Bugula neritina]|uniref:Uncharacterized protein n=1 Tax=Bugula neritina TaxID=10212 RepID=A0A7J7KSM1_BUGNE|nr:hypothetical protein EB796_000510 [Bugula neritina]
MAALDEKEKEVSTEAAEKESVKAALDEVTKTLMYLQEDLSNNYMPLSSHQDALGKAADQEDKVRRELIALRGSLDSYSKEAIEAKNVCSMQNILINEKDRELRDKEKELKSLRRELDSKAEALSNVNSQLQQSNRDRDRDRDRLRDEMMAMTRSLEPHTATINYKTMYDELKVDKEREKATTDQLIERLKWEISTLEERLEKAKAELQDKIKLETNYLLAQGEAERFKQEASDLMKKVTRLEERVDHQQRDSDYLKESRHEIGASNQNLKDENSRLRENNTELKSRLTQMERELSSYSVTKTRWSCLSYCQVDN